MSGRPGGGLGSVASLARRRPPIGRLVGAYGLFILSEYVAWVVVLVIAFKRGGATEAGLVALAQLAPAAVAAPYIARLCDRYPPWTVLYGGYVVQGAGLVVAGGAAALGDVLGVYVGSVVASVAVVTARPAQAALLPRLATAPEDLTEANVLVGWIENLGVIASGLVAGWLLAASGPTAGLVLAGVASLLGGAMVWKLGHRVVVGHDASHLAAEHGPRPRLGPEARLLLALLTVQWVLIGGLDVLFVVIAIDVLGAGDGWVGYLQTGFGIGGLLATVVAALLVGRRLAWPILGSAVAAGACLALVAVAPGVWTSAVLLALVGAFRSLLDVAGRTLLQRSVPPHLLGRVFGQLEGLTMAALAVGSLLVPVFVELGGDRGAIVGIALVLPLVALLGGRRLMSVDAAATVPVVEISLLRDMRMFGGLPPPALESVAMAMERRTLAPDEVLIREGDPGDAYYVIADGALHIERGGRSLGLRHRGDGVGEIALLTGTPRTATVSAHGAATVYELGRQPFLAAVSGHPGTTGLHPVAATILDERLRDDDPAADA
ncbi:MFS transporter [Nocardioides sp. HDW12B]|uniref:cyclic nucleotide-binding domain-containing protein n=1 Tax=Nocardioides sp. HDW12B TaxID=2714939 RepID=UPI00140ACE60|nr:cyclic nucleotide-binding domain-containing protein [Nocardioides sp. HDW12B]QIK66303.1 MFS transporter [Nocardioides sp. HDW12B]